MMNLYPGTGMGASGTGIGPMGAATGAGISPQVLQMIRMMGAQQAQQPMGGMGAPGGPGAPMAAPGPMTGGPMSAFIGAGGQPPPTMPPPQMMPPPQPLNQPQAIGNPIAGLTSQLQGAQQLQGLLQHLQQPPGQTGVPPNAAGGGAMGGAMGANPAMMQQLLNYLHMQGSGAMPVMPGAGGGAPTG